MSDIYFRAFVGPHWSTNSNFFWTTFDYGAADDLDFATTLTDTLETGATSGLNIADGAGFAATAAVWVGPNGSGEAWEPISYLGTVDHTTYVTLAVLTREPLPNREHNGRHTAGATVRQWMPVDTDNGRLRIVRELNDELCATSWYAELSGVRYPQRCMRNDHVIIVQTAPLLGGPWTNTLVGFVDSPSVADTGDKRAEWRVRIMCSAGIMGNTQVRGVRVGDWDIAREASATASPAIPAAWKEFGSTDFDGTQRTFEADNVLDGRPDTLWIADELVGTQNDAAASSPDYDGIEQMHINPTASIGIKGNCWVAITNFNFDGNGWQIRVYTPSTNAFHYSDTFTGAFGVPNVGSGDYVIICDNAEAFTAQNPAARPAAIVSVEEMGTGKDIFRYFEPGGGAVILHASILGIDHWESLLCWGTQDEKPTGDTWGGGDWDIGTSIDAPARGQTMRRIHGAAGPPSHEADYWETSYRQSPGYLIDFNEDQVWLKVAMPSMEIELAADINTSVTTIPLRWGDTPSTDGLPASGTILIDEEEITYTVKGATGISSCTRHQNGTFSATHTAGTKVRVVQDFNPEGDFGGPVATDGYPLESLSWYMENGSIVPRDFDMLFTARENGRTPDQGQHERDYPLAITYDNNTDAFKTVTISPALHVKTFLFQTGEMSENPARPRLTRVAALVDPAFFDDAYWLSSGTDTVEETLERIAINAGMNSDAITVTAGGQTPTGHVTAADGAWSVLVDLADYGNGYIAIALDSKLIFRPNFIWTTGVGEFTPSYTWAAADLMRVEKVWQRGGGIGQVKLNWVTPDGLEQDAVSYPTTADTTGRIEEIGPFICADEAAATLAARKRYYLGKYPYTALAQLDEGDLAINVGAVASLTWQFDEEMQPIDRFYLTKSVEHVIESGSLVTTVNLIEIDREAA